MKREWIEELAQSFVADSSYNIVQEEDAISQDTCGLKIYESLVFAFGASNDPLFFKLKEPGVIGPHFMLPQDWLPGAKTVISFFLSFTEAVKRSNVLDPARPSPQWLHARIEGQELIRQLCLFLKSNLESSGCKAVVPLTDPRFWSKSNPDYTSNWSERHVAYICGLGTFGLSKGIITKVGMAGRLGSIITDSEFSYDARPYKDPYEYCIRCGCCADRCPAHAISLQEGKLHPPCSAFVDETHKTYYPRYGCGKCQVAVPCESCIPS